MPGAAFFSRSDTRATRSVCALALAGVAIAMVLTGCSAGRPATATGAGEVPLAGSAIGSYGAGARLILATGDSLVVPAGWRAHFSRAGALVTTASPGGSIEDLQLGFVEVTAYGPQVRTPDDFATVLAGTEQEYRRTRNGADAGTMKGAGLKGTAHLLKLGRRVELHLGSETSATAYVSTWSSRPQVLRVSARRRVDIYVSRAGTSPLRIFFDLIAPIPGLEKASLSDLPTRLLDYIDFKPR